MQIIEGSENIKKDSLSGAVLTMGNFDGVHLGHQSIIGQIVECAKKARMQSVVYTFNPHPAKIMAPDIGLRLLQTKAQKLSEIEKLKVDACIVEKFSKEFAARNPGQFLNNILLERIKPSQIIVGYDLTFGHHRQGTIDMLREFGSRHGIIVHVVDAMFYNEILISSSQIRKYIFDGNVDAAKNLLGRPFELTGRVVHGRGFGNKIGFHTANIAPENELIPKTGIYITKTLEHLSVTNIGFNPTFGGKDIVIETHILGFSKDIYDKTIDVQFFERIRDEKTFDSPEHLAEQIRKDILAAKKYAKEQKI